MVVFFMNKRQRIICQILVLWLVGVTAIAISDYKTPDNNAPQDEGKMQVSEVTMNGINGVYNPICETNCESYSQSDSVLYSQSESVLECQLESTGDCQPNLYPTYVTVENYDSDEDFTNQETYESMTIPYGSTDSYMFMDYRAITDTSSLQWQLQQYAYDGNYGIRMVDGCYCVAVSSMYGNIGDKIKVTTDKGNSYWCIIADIKGYDSVNGWYHVNSQGTINLIEFVVNDDLIPNECWQFGDMGVLDNIGGNVVKVERLE